MKLSSVRIRATDFPSHRRRRRRDQNSTCCCLVMVLVCALAALIAARKPIIGAVGRVLHHGADEGPPRPDFPLTITLLVDQPCRYDIIPVQVTYCAADGTPMPDTAPELFVRNHEGEKVETVGEVEALPLRYDPQAGVWRGSWPVPFGAETGPDKPYTFEAAAEFSPVAWEWETPEEKARREKENKKRARPVSQPKPGETATCTATAQLVVNRAPLRDIPPGTCAVTWEYAFPTGDQFIKPDGTRGDWRTMFDWAEFMGADTLWYRGAVTEVYSAAGALTAEQPWVRSNLNAVPTLAAEAKRRGLRFGVWAVAMETYPNGPSQHRNAKQWKPPYRFTQDYSRSRGVLTEEAAVSLLDELRPKHLAQFFADMQALDGVDHVGLDYIRSGADWGGWELAEEFAQTMPVVGLPENWSHLSPTQRMGWMCRNVDGSAWQSNTRLYHQWNWFRAHKISQILRRMIEDSKLEKPLWTFTLSWWHGEQHGQDPLMFADAGVAINAVMLYECETLSHFDSLMSQWHDGISVGDKGIPAGHANIMGGDEITFALHQRLTRPAATEEMYRRLTVAADGLTEGGPLWGAFVHDIHRICSPAPGLVGNRGPYPPREWALAGAAAFSKVRANWGVQPVKCSLTVPKSASVGSTVAATLHIHNTCGEQIESLDVEVLNTAGINRVTKQRQVAELAPSGEVKVPVEFQVTGFDSSRASRYMLAVQIRWPEGDYGEGVREDLPRLYTVMGYINAG